MRARRPGVGDRREARPLGWPALVRILIALAATGAAVLAFAPTVNGFSFWDFTLDDSYITYRYSDHLAGGHGPVWNVGEDPVEGYTSFLWMLVAAVGILAGADAETWAKIVSLLAVVGVMLILAFYGRCRLLPARLIAIAAVALSPIFMAATLQGMETAVAGLLATSGAVMLIEAVRRPTWSRFGGYFLVALLGTLTRPDLLPYFAVTSVGLALFLARSDDRRALGRAAAAFAAAFVLPGAAYLAWRWSYYGYPLPNTYYVKRGSGLVGSLGVQYVRDFILQVAWPYLLVTSVLFARAVIQSGRTQRPLEREMIGIGCVFAAVLAFLAAGVLVDPLQGQLSRFQMPIYPVLALLVVLLSPADIAMRIRSNQAAQAGAAIAVSVLVLFPLHTLGEARFQIEARWQYDRQVAGKALHDLRSLDVEMLVTESGALPYYSTWRATDLLGLNDEHIAHRGLSADYLRRLAPDLVMFAAHLRPGQPFQVVGYYHPLRQLVHGGVYRFADAHVKTDPDLRSAGGLVHVYLVRRTSDHATTIARRLRAIQLVRRPGREEVGPILDAFGIDGPR